MKTSSSNAASTPRRAAATAVLLGCLLLNACKVGPNFTRPEAPGADKYVAESANGGAAPDQRVQLGHEIEGNWWQLFQSSSLDAVVAAAIEKNYTLAESSASLARARELTLAREGERFPQIGLTAGIGRQKYGQEFLGGFFNLPPFTYFAVGPVVSYTLDYNGGVARGIEEQRAFAEVARQQLDAAYLSVSGQAVLQMLSIASIRAQIATVETILDQDRQNLKLVQTAFQAGSVSRIDVVSAESQLAADRSLLPPLRQDVDRAHHALSVLLGRVPAAELPADADLAGITLPMELPVSLPSELAHRRPDILAAEARLHAATSEVGVAESNLYPKIQISGSLGNQNVRASHLFDGSSLAWSAISGLTMPLFDGGTLRAEKRAAVDAMRASAANYQQTVLEAFAQVADMLDALQHDAEALSAQAEAQAAAQSNLDLARAAYNEGNAGILQVLDAERQWQRANLGYVRAVGQRYLDTAQLFLALGGSVPSSQESPQAAVLTR
jgi:NodT family efflux transporter outer membrane factor (OMF) lipoprotein